MNINENLILMGSFVSLFNSYPQQNKKHDKIFTENQ